MFKAIIIAAAVIAAVPARAAEYTTEQCDNIYLGLLQLDRKPEGGQYKMPDARLAIALDMDALRATYESSQRARLDISVGVTGSKKAEDVTPVENKKIQDDWMAYIGRPCPVSNLRHIDFNALNVGDGDGKNAIPPSVIGLLRTILDNVPEK